MQVVTVTPVVCATNWVPMRNTGGSQDIERKNEGSLHRLFLEMINFNRKTHGFVGNARILLRKAPMSCGLMFSQYSHLVVQPITGKEDQKNNAYQMFQTFSNLDQGENAKKELEFSFTSTFPKNTAGFPENVPSSLL